MERTGGRVTGERHKWRPRRRSRWNRQPVLVMQLVVRPELQTFRSSRILLNWMQQQAVAALSLPCPETKFRRSARLQGALPCRAGPAWAPSPNIRPGCPAAPGPDKAWIKLILLLVQNQLFPSSSSLPRVEQDLQQVPGESQKVRPSLQSPTGGSSPLTTRSGSGTWSRI